MNEFATTENSSGLLKNQYEDSGLAEVLRRKREKLAETKLGLIDEDKREDNKRN